MRICYRCDQFGHVKVNSLLLTAKPAQVPVPAIMRITDGRQGKVEPPRAQGRAFQITVEEASKSPGVVTCMFVSVILLIKFLLCLYMCTLVSYVPSELLACFSFA